MSPRRSFILSFGFEFMYLAIGGILIYSILVVQRSSILICFIFDAELIFF